MRKGQALIEYALMLALVLLVSMPAVGSAGRQIPVALDPPVKALGGEQVSPTPVREPTPIVVTVTPPVPIRTPTTEPEPPTPTVPPSPTKLPPQITPTVLPPYETPIVPPPQKTPTPPRIPLPTPPWDEW
jgi:hypothetical protein